MYGFQSQSHILPSSFPYAAHGFDIVYIIHVSHIIVHVIWHILNMPIFLHSLHITLIIWHTIRSSLHIVLCGFLHIYMHIFFANAYCAYLCAHYAY
jgi:hypothetical protein